MARKVYFFVFLAIFFFVSVSVEAVEGRRYLRIGADPMDKGICDRLQLKTIRLPHDVEAVVGTGSGKRVRGWIPAGTQVSVGSDGLAERICACGNVIHNRIVVEEAMPPAQTVRVEKPAPTPAPAPVQQAAPVKSEPRVFCGPGTQVVAQQDGSYYCLAVQQRVTCAYGYYEYQGACYPYQQPQQEKKLSCRERKTGWGSVIGGLVGAAAGILTKNPWWALGGGTAGGIIGGYIDGGCIEPSDVTTGMAFGGTGMSATHILHHPKTPGPQGPQGPQGQQGQPGPQGPPGQPVVNPQQPPVPPPVQPGVPPVNPPVNPQQPGIPPPLQPIINNGSSGGSFSSGGSSGGSSSSGSSGGNFNTFFGGNSSGASNSGSFTPGPAPAPQPLPTTGGVGQPGIPGTISPQIF